MVPLPINGSRTKSPFSLPAFIQGSIKSGGYTATQLPVRIGQRIVRAWLWIAFPDNPNFIRDESLETSLEVIRRAEGASGPNVDYVINLCDALQKSDIIDDYLIMVCRALKELLSKDEH